MSNFIDFLLAKPTIKRKLDMQDAYNTSNNETIARHQQLILDEINKLKICMQSQRSDIYMDYKGLEEVHEFLRTRQVTPDLVKKFMAYMEHTCTIEQLQNYEYAKNQLHTFLKSKIIPYVPKQNKTKQCIHLLVGPSGSGKTNTIFKLVAYFQQQYNKNKSDTTPHIRVASIDNQKIGEVDYLQKIAAYMDVESQLFINHDELLEFMRKGIRPDLLLIDSPGINPVDKKQIITCAHSLSHVIEKANVLLLIPANTSDTDLQCMLNEFKIFNYQGVVITKIDEVSHPSRVISICMDYEVPIAYLSDGKDIIHNLKESNEEILFRYFNIL